MRSEFWSLEKEWSCPFIIAPRPAFELQAISQSVSRYGSYRGLSASDLVLVWTIFLCSSCPQRGCKRTPQLNGVLSEERDWPALSLQNTCSTKWKRFARLLLEVFRRAASFTRPLRCLESRFAVRSDWIELPPVRNDFKSHNSNRKAEDRSNRQ